jgi:hypothetical protein
MFAIVADVGYFFFSRCIIIIICMIPIIYRNYVIVDNVWVFGGGGGVRMGYCSWWTSVYWIVSSTMLATSSSVDDDSGFWMSFNGSVVKDVRGIERNMLQYRE